MTRSHLETASSARVDLEQRGYVIARGLLPLDLLEELQKKVTAELTSLHVSTGELTEQHQPVFVPTGDDPIEAALLPRTSRDEILEEIFQSPEALEFVRQLFDGSAVFSHPTKWMRALPPACAWRRPPSKAAFVSSRVWTRKCCRSCCEVSPHSAFCWSRGTPPCPPTASAPP